MKYLSHSNPDRLAWIPGKVGQFRGNGDPRHGHGSRFRERLLFTRDTKGYRKLIGLDMKSKAL